MPDKLIKPIATALWLLEKSRLTFKQIADFCNLTEEVISEMENGFSRERLQPHNPVLLGQLTTEEINRCEKDPNTRLALTSSPIHKDVIIKKSKKVYTPSSQKNDKISATLWLLKNTELNIEEISELIVYPKKTIESIKEGTNPKFQETAMRDPVMLGLCTQVQLNNFMNRKDKGDNKNSSPKKISKK